MNIQPGNKDWWLLVQSMPLTEAETMLRDYKATLLANNPVGSPNYFAAGVEVQRVNAELHRLSQIENRATWMKAMRNVLTPEQLACVCEERERLEQMARLELA